MTIQYCHQATSLNGPANTADCKELLGFSSVAPGPWKRIHKSGTSPLIRRIFENTTSDFALWVETPTELIFHAYAQSKEELEKAVYPQPNHGQAPTPLPVPSPLLNGHPISAEVVQVLSDMLDDPTLSLSEQLDQYLACANHGLQHHHSTAGPSGIRFDNGMLHVGILTPALSIPIPCLPEAPTQGQTGDDYIEEHFNWY